MTIEESQVWWYWPQVFWESAVDFRPRFYDYPAGYEAIWNSFDGIKQDGENVSRADIMAGLDALPGGPSYYFPEGFLRTDVETLIFPLNQEMDFWDRTAPEPHGEDKIQAQLSGYISWQWYRLLLAMQASKLTEFGRRGRRSS